MTGTCQPIHERALHAHISRGSWPGARPSPVRQRRRPASYSSSDGSARPGAARAGGVRSRRPAHWSCADMAETDDGHLMASLDLRGDQPDRRRAIRSISATDVPPNFITSRDTAGSSPYAWAKKSRLLAGVIRNSNLRSLVLTMTATAPSSIDPAEVERFRRIAAEWWDPPFVASSAPLHKFQPGAAGLYPRSGPWSRFGRDQDAATRRPFEGLSLLDIGCGGGVVVRAHGPAGVRGHRGGRVRAQYRHSVSTRGPANPVSAIDRRASTAEALESGGRQTRSILDPQYGGDRACGRSGRVPAHHGAAAGPGRSDDRRHLEPHGQGLCPGHGRGGIRAALAAGRHPRLDALPHARRSSAGFWRTGSSRWSRSRARSASVSIRCRAAGPARPTTQRQLYDDRQA